MKSIGRHVDTVSHPELLPLEAGKSIQSLGVIIFILQGFKRTGCLPFFLLVDPDAAAAESKGKHIDSKGKS